MTDGGGLLADVLSYGELVARAIGWLIRRPGRWLCKMLPFYRRRDPAAMIEVLAGLALWGVIVAFQAYLL